MVFNQEIIYVNNNNNNAMYFGSFEVELKGLLEIKI